MLADLRNALRTLVRSPGYALTCIAVLALGIGANAAIFSVVYSVVLAPLPYPDVPRLVWVWERFPNMPDPPGGRIHVARRNFEEWKRQSSSFDELAALACRSPEETGIDHPRHVPTAYNSAVLFAMLGAKPRLGRLFTSNQETGVAVISDKYFEGRFHRDPAALGKTIQLGGSVFSVIGVLPPRFHLPSTMEGQDQCTPEVWLPLARMWVRPEDDLDRQLLVAARLKHGVPLGQARTEMAGIAKRLEKSEAKLDEGWTTAVFPFTVEESSPTLRRALLVLLGAVAFLLLIACANLANLTLARATLRSREIAIRLALGATRGRIVGQLVSESLAVSIAGALAGLVLAHWCIKLMLALEPPDIQRPELIGINMVVFGFSAAISVIAALLFGLAPALAVSKADLNSALKSSGWGTSAARVRSRQFLIVAEVALALMLVSGAGLMIRSFHELVKTGIGFQTTQLMTADIDLPDGRYADGAAQSRFFRSLMDRVRAIAGVEDATVIDNMPLHQVRVQNFYIAGRPEPATDSLPISDYASISPNYFRLIGLRLLAGRAFTEQDRAAGEKGPDSVVIVNQSFAKQFFPGENPLGKRLLSPDKKHGAEIVGIVADYNAMGAENKTRPQRFWPALSLRSATLIVRTRGEPKSFTKPIQNAVWSLDKDIPMNVVKPLESYVDEWQSQRKFNTLLLGFFAALALVLALMGIYGVLSNLVASRVREIGIRMAIGATPAGIGGLMLRQSMIPVAIGLAIGLAGAMVLSRFLESLLFQVQSRDPLTLTLAAAVILVTSPAALFVPLRRATSVDCTIALREE